MNGMAEFLLSEDEKSLLKAIQKSRSVQGNSGVMLFPGNMAAQINGLSMVDYSKTSLIDLWHSMFGLMSSQIQEFTGKRA